MKEKKKITKTKHPEIVMEFEASSEKHKKDQYVSGPCVQALC